MPSTGVTKVGEVDKTTPPEPVEAAVTPVPPLATGNVPDDMFAAFKAVKPEPAPVTVVSVATFAVKLP